jgi:hypothetical protein
MPTVVTALDPRFSAPDASATSWEQTRRILEDAELSWISFDAVDGAFRHARGGVSQVFELVPTRVLAFAKSPFAQTRHRFPTDRRGDLS